MHVLDLPTPIPRPLTSALLLAARTVTQLPTLHQLARASLDASLEHAVRAARGHNITAMATCIARQADLDRGVRVGRLVRAQEARHGA